MTAGGIVGEYLALKEETSADLLAMQMGDFYEFFHDDAREVGEVLDLKVSERSAGGETYEMAGVPVAELPPYLAALVERGYRVAVADQHETADGHERRIDRVATPGTVLEESSPDARYLAAVIRADAGAGLAFVDVSTGRFHATSIAGDDVDDRLLTELYRFAPAEVLLAPDVADAWAAERLDATITAAEADLFAPGRARHALTDQFGEGALAALGIEDDDLAVRAAGAALGYVAETGTGSLASVTRLQAYGADEHVALDATTQRTLELVETMTGEGDSLLRTLDHTATSGGHRQLRDWLTRPRRDEAELTRRQDAIAALASAALPREELRDALEGAADLERLVARAISGSADAAALVRVRTTLALLPDLAETIEADPRVAGSPVAAVLDRLDRDALADLRTDLDAALVDDPRRTDDGVVRPGYDDELDAVVERHADHLDWIEGLAEREAGRHGLDSLSVDRNRTDCYYIQVAKRERDAVPDDYEGIKTLKNAERYVTDELGEREREILRLEERRDALERTVVADLRERVAQEAAAIQAVGRALAELDVFAALAAHAVRNDWTRPTLTADRTLDVAGGRHPVVEQATAFVPNDLAMADDRRFLVVTGPNMSGKSTYMRQAALIVLLAQVGSFVPADEATVGLVDGIYTRVGALDELAQGRSTFMVEMQELSNILHSATDESLVVLDEVGRGTATYDGISIAWAATEYLHNEVGARTLFATHYHELTDLAAHLPRVENVHVAAEERDGEVTFLRTVRDGPGDRSYGIHVAGLAGVPDPVVDRARTVLDRLRADEAIEARGGDRRSVQAVFDLGSGRFRGSASADGGDPPLDPEVEAVIAELRETDVAGTAPIDLAATVQAWQSRLPEE